MFRLLGMTTLALSGLGLLGCDYIKSDTEVGETGDTSESSTPVDTSTGVDTSTSVDTNTTDLCDDTGVDGGGSGVSIYDIQTGANKDSPVTLRGVIATTRGVGSYSNSFALQDVCGGPQTGIYVSRHVKTAAGEDIERGKTYNITGYVSSSDAGSILWVSEDRDITELNFPLVEPTVNVVDPNATEDWSIWEGSLVSLSSVTVGALNAIDGGLRLGGTFYTASLNEGDTIGELIGIVHFNSGTWWLNPRGAQDLVDVVPAE